MDDNVTIDALNGQLREVCPSLYSADDATYSKVRNCEIRAYPDEILSFSTVSCTLGNLPTFLNSFSNRAPQPQTSLSTSCKILATHSYFTKDVDQKIELNHRDQVPSLRLLSSLADILQCRLFLQFGWYGNQTKLSAFERLPISAVTIASAVVIANL